MIHIQEKAYCCGCSACVQVCPKKCISFREDEEGFAYPSVDATHCVSCGLCEKVCPILNKSERTSQQGRYYVAKSNNEEIRLASSSGGVFSELATEVLDKGGVVYGAAFDENWNVRHIAVETKEELQALRGSKYVQSKIGDTYIQVRRYLQTGRLVLFSGTPCQVAGLKSFLKKDFEKLIAVSIVCHGVPSPKIWREYLGLLTDTRNVQSISFRNKTHGWASYCLSVIKTGSEAMLLPNDKDLYMRGFMSDLFLRPSCYKCVFKGGACGSDIILGDCWGIDKLNKDLNDKKGLNVCIILSDKGEKLYGLKNLTLCETNSDFMAKHNVSYMKATSEPKNRQKFFSSYISTPLELLSCLKKYVTYPRWSCKKCIKKIIFYQKLKKVWKKYC